MVKPKPRLVFPKLRDPTAFGGALLDRGNPRYARPLSPSQSMHLVLRSTRAYGSRSFLAPANARRIQKLVFSLGRRLRVRVYNYANSGNHLHLLLQPSTRAAYRAYVRALSGIVARIALRAKHSRTQGLRFWDRRPWSRIVSWGDGFETVLLYIERNTMETLGALARRSVRLRPG